MPRGDRTGPTGHGPRTGRAAGFCTGYDAPGYMNDKPGWGRGFGHRAGGWGQRRGWGRRAFGWMHRGWGWEPAAVPTREEELQMLRRSAESIEAELETIQRRIDALEGETDSDKPHEGDTA